MKIGHFFITIFIIYMLAGRGEPKVRKELLIADLRSVVKFMEDNAWHEPMDTIMRRLLIIGGLLSDAILKALIDHFEKDTATDIDIQTAIDTINNFVENVKIAENETLDIIHTDKKFFKVAKLAIKHLQKAKEEAQGSAIPSFG